MWTGGWLHNNLNFVRTFDALHCVNNLTIIEPFLLQPCVEQNVLSRAVKVSSDNTTLLITGSFSGQTYETVLGSAMSRSQMLKPERASLASQFALEPIFWNLSFCRTQTVGQSKETSFPQVTTGQLELCLRAQGLRLDRGVLNRWA